MVVSTGTKSSPAWPVVELLVNLMRTGRSFTAMISGPR